MTRYATIDQTLSEWAARVGLHLFTRHHGEDVRSFQVVGPSGKKAQLWVEVEGRLTVHVSDYRRRHKVFEATPSNLGELLDGGLRIAREWTEVGS